MSAPQTIWQPAPPKTFALSAGEVHVWRTAAASSPAQEQRLAQWLLPEERARAARYKFERDQRRAIVTQGTLRRLLGWYLDQPPEKFRFVTGPHGKPALLEPASLRFNLSHSHGLVLLAFAWNVELGVDVETLRPEVEAEQLTKRYFSPAEQTEWERLPATERRLGFFLGWTRKEAYLKGRGEGLSRPLDSFSVSLTPGQPACLVQDTLDPKALQAWSLQALEPGPERVGALAVAGAGCRLSCWDWRPEDQPAFPS